MSKIKTWMLLGLIFFTIFGQASSADVDIIPGESENAQDQFYNDRQKRIEENKNQFEEVIPAGSLTEIGAQNLGSSESTGPTSKTGLSQSTPDLTISSTNQNSGTTSNTTHSGISSAPSDAPVTSTTPAKKGQSLLGILLMTTIGLCIFTLLVAIFTTIILLCQRSAVKKSSDSESGGSRKISKPAPSKLEFPITQNTNLKTVQTVKNDEVLQLPSVRESDEVKADEAKADEAKVNDAKADGPKSGGSAKEPDADQADGNSKKADDKEEGKARDFDSVKQTAG